jgi:hypothetical protein
MGGDNSQTTTSGLNNSALNKAVSTIGSQLNAQIGKGVTPFSQSLYPGLSGQTQQGVAGLANNPNNAAYGSAVGNTIKDFGAIASGQRFGMNDPGYATLRQNAINDATTGVASSFLTDGRFGSSVMGDAAGEAIAGTIAGLDFANFQNDQQRQMQAAGMLPGLYQGSQLPAIGQLTAGQIKDADMLATRQGAADLFDRTQNAGWNTLARASQVLAGTAPSAGQTTTQTQQQPWWQAPLQIGGTLAGAFF